MKFSGYCKINQPSKFQNYHKFHDKKEIYVPEYERFYFLDKMESIYIPKNQAILVLNFNIDDIYQ